MDQDQERASSDAIETESVEELNIPTIDLGDLFHYERKVRETAAAEIRRGFSAYGLIYVLNHGVDFELRDRLYERFAAFTALPQEEKERLNRPDLYFQRGWTPPNTEQAVVAGGQPDFKECYFAAPIESSADMALQYPQLYADNLWPEQVEMKDDYLLLGRQLHEAGLGILEGCAIALGLGGRYFDHKLQGGPHVFRLLRYLPLSAAQTGTDILWGEEHTDFNLLTVLPGGQFRDPQGSSTERPDDGSGLYLRTPPSKAHPQGQKIRGAAPEGCIVAQVGQQLEILTGGELRATPHVITAPETPDYTRIAGAHFLHLHSHQMLFPHRKFCNPQSLQAYRPPVLAGTYSVKTLVDIGLAPESALDDLGYRHYGRLAEMREGPEMSESQEPAPTEES